MSWSVNFYQSQSGDSPVKDFIEKQDIVLRIRVAHSIKLLFDQGPFLKPPYIKKLGKRFYELRISGLIPIRIFYTIYNGEYYLLHAFKKKTQKTPLHEIKTALYRMGKII
ncbi:type II toxin-antitoxin system RelE/ParE family toxin [Candidatus Gottesmanbacteria bacterium]|nr:type II toxin-antitoxin system RelE/ParE family toxin [Candidatus Gottesmanbacteria bacterium]